jgi:glycosyltransferase involved in cell wall biosynthesis
VFHSPDFVLPPTWRARTVLTVHDLSFLTTPHTSDPALRRYLMDAVPRSVARADRILADSESTQRDLVRHLSVEPERIRVVYPGVGPEFQPLDSQAVGGVRARYGLDGPFVLSVGTLQPRKNYPLLIEAYGRLRELDPALGDVSLVIAGGRGWLYDEIDATIERLGETARVRLLGFVPEEDLPALYNAAAAFAMPSLYEGFGIPVVEALACGTPVVASNVSSLPEAGGDAALLVPPDDVAAVADALRRLLTDRELRATLRQRGFAHAQRFTWEAAAQTVVAVYRELAGDKTRRRSQRHSISIL